MILSERANALKSSSTLKTNEKVQQLKKKGHRVFNLTAGQLPIRPYGKFIDRIGQELKFLKSFLYSPIAGMPELKKMFLDYITETRDIPMSNNPNFDCIISNGAKHSIYNALGVLVNPGDEILMLSPYWVSYPEMIKMWGGVPVAVDSKFYSSFVPDIEELKAKITKKTKAIILNSPNNPAGIHYPDEWMNEFSKVIAENKHVYVISDEIYYLLSYYDPKPTYFYQKNKDLLERTIIVDGISKSLASTGLRIGFTVGPKDFVAACAKLQGQTTSGASSLIQRALITLNFNHDKVEDYLKPIKSLLRTNTAALRDKYREFNLGQYWYQPLSAFYYLIDFSRTPVFKKFCPDVDPISSDSLKDYSGEICEEILDQKGVALVPGTDFGTPNSARMSLVVEAPVFKEAIDLLFDYLSYEV